MLAFKQQKLKKNEGVWSFNFPTLLQGTIIEKKLKAWMPPYTQPKNLKKKNAKLGAPQHSSKKKIKKEVILSSPFNAIS